MRGKKIAPTTRDSFFIPAYEMKHVPEDDEENEGLLSSEVTSFDRKSFLDVDSSTVLRGLSSVYEETDFPVPQQKFLLKFPVSMEKRLQPIDNAIIGVCQRFRGKFFLFLDLFITGCSAIETGIAAPFCMFVLGWDGIATELSYLMLLTCVLSQIPKRFIWRWRPYMVWRAQKIRKTETAVTSSFPSRAVTCATVYAFMIIYAYIFYIEKTTFFITWWMPFVILLAVFMSSFARINMGVHYPSDCLAGFIQGIIVCIIGTMLWHADSVGCDSCIGGKCYAIEGSGSEIDKSNLQRINFTVVGVGLLISLLITIVSVVKPVDFWGKCDRVYGMLLPGILFQVTFLCKRTAGTALAIPAQCPWYGYFYGVGFTGIATFIAWRNNGKFPVLSFAIQFIMMFCALAFWRLWVLSTE